MEEDERTAQEAGDKTPQESVQEAGEEARQDGRELSREEILSRAKRENANGDERQRSQMQWANYAGFIATELACIIVMFSKIFMSDEFTPEFFCIMFTGVAAQNIVQACVTKKRTIKIVFTVCAALITAATAIYWVFWILGLCGIHL